MSGLRNMSLHHNNNVSRSMNSINDRREIEFETNLFVDFSCFILWAVFGIIVIVNFKKLHIKKVDKNLILNAEIIVIEFWKNYQNKNTNFWECHWPCQLLIQNLKYYSFLLFALKSMKKFRDVSMHSTRNNSAIHIVIHVIV